MDRLTPDELIRRKKSDTIVIFGSGYSINRIKAHQWKNIDSSDSIGFNWFCKHSYEPTFFLIREQANVKKRISSGETPGILFGLVNRYDNTCAIVINTKKTAPTSLNYARKLNRIGLSGVVFKERKLNRVQKMACNPFEYGLCHGKCTLFSVLHFVTYMKYKTLVFAGMDLNDSRYFWLKKNETRHNIIKKGKKYRKPHPIAKTTLKLISKFKRSYKVNLYTLNRKSKLKTIMPVIDW